MPTEQFTIQRRPGFEFLGAITVTIECDPSALSGVKIGLAVRAAVKSRANLTGANLTGANLSGAEMMPVEPYERFVAEGWRQIARPPGGEGLFYERTISPGGGFCGLAGAPQ